MVILEGDAEGLDGALKLIKARPNQNHVAEYYQVTRERKSISAMVDDSVAVSSVVGYAENNGESFAGGVELQGFLKYQIWMLSTSDAGQSPKWLLRSARKLLSHADRFFGYPCSYYQVIPASYYAGLRFVAHLGFAKTRRIECDDDREDLILVERSIPRWAQ